MKLCNRIANLMSSVGHKFDNRMARGLSRTLFRCCIRMRLLEMFTATSRENVREKPKPKAEICSRGDGN